MVTGQPIRIANILEDHDLRENYVDPAPLLDPTYLDYYRE
jgi:hypothetical protein